MYVTTHIHTRYSYMEVPDKGNDRYGSTRVVAVCGQRVHVTRLCVRVHLSNIRAEPVSHYQQNLITFYVADKCPVTRCSTTNKSRASLFRIYPGQSRNSLVQDGNNYKILISRYNKMQHYTSELYIYDGIVYILGTISCKRFYVFLQRIFKMNI